MVQKNEVDLNAVKHWIRVEKGLEKEPSRFDKKLLEIQAKFANVSKEFLFFYSVWTFIQDKQHSTLTEIQAEGKLKQFPKMEVYYCRMEGSPDKPPAILKGRKILKEIVNGHEKLAELISQKTGVTVSDTDLMIKQTAWSEKPLQVRVMAFMKSVDAAKAKDQEIQRIVKCLKENDPRKRKDCLNNCNI